ncbi:hypothetical protein ABL78_8572 [Leptomonas seymouri]|uniref:Uncharacterized protein n=1 Tax=Leptomonas seymouri TaxID=5684 RepID=A0A0N1HSH2_LEPSE|nr:hypothetical protein ABL78_8572 [Leptomonas seymouri]|eukprot:KPI82418.1 hypothetical protein ABL78_8572 [Leptomonas seymouri]
MALPCTRNTCKRTSRPQLAGSVPATRGPSPCTLTSVTATNRPTMPAASSGSDTGVAEAIPARGTAVISLSGDRSSCTEPSAEHLTNAQPQ